MKLRAIYRSILRAMFPITAMVEDLSAELPGLLLEVRKASMGTAHSNVQGCDDCPFTSMALTHPDGLHLFCRHPAHKSRGKHCGGGVLPGQRLPNCPGDVLIHFEELPEQP